MPKRANPMAVRANITYDVFEAARALKVSPATVRAWIKDGMEAMTSCKPYLILGAAIRTYLKAKYKAAKRPLGPYQLFCTSCKQGCSPLGLQVILTPISVTTDLLKGQCARCGSTATRMISHAQRDNFSGIFQVAKRAKGKA